MVASCGPSGQVLAKLKALVDKLASQLADSLENKPANENLETATVEKMGLDTLDEKITAAAVENPQTREQSTREKTQTEKIAKAESTDKGRMPGGQKTQAKEEEGLRPSAQ